MRSIFGAAALVLTMAGTASAQTCADTEVALRERADALRAFVAKMDHIKSQYNAAGLEREAELMIAEDYGWTDEGADMVNQLERDMLGYQTEWKALQQLAAPAESALGDAVGLHNAICQKDARAQQILQEQGLFLNGPG